MNMDASSQISKCLEKVNSNNSSRHATGSNRGILQTETKAFKVFFSCHDIKKPESVTGIIGK